VIDKSLKGKILLAEWGDLCRNLCSAMAFKEWEFLADLMIVVFRIESADGEVFPDGSCNPIGYHAVSGEPSVAAREVVSGEIKRYRVFPTFEKAAFSLLYSILYSGNDNYVQARLRFSEHMVVADQLQSQADAAKDAARETFAADFGEAYSGQEHYRELVVRLLEEDRDV